MKKLVFVSVCDDEVGEVEGMFQEDGTLIDMWANNDATWRSEYFSGILEYLGAEEVRLDWRDTEVTELWEGRLVEAAKEYWGY